MAAILYPQLSQRIFVQPLFLFLIFKQQVYLSKANMVLSFMEPTGVQRGHTIKQEAKLQPMITWLPPASWHKCLTWHQYIFRRPVFTVDDGEAHIQTKAISCRTHTASSDSNSNKSLSSQEAGTGRCGRGARDPQAHHSWATGQFRGLCSPWSSNIT